MADCVICQDPIYGYGNNPAPLNHECVCCNYCNTAKVIPARLANGDHIVAVTGC